MGGRAPGPPRPQPALVHVPCPAPGSRETRQWRARHGWRSPVAPRVSVRHTRFASTHGSQRPVAWCRLLGHPESLRLECDRLCGYHLRTREGRGRAGDPRCLQSCAARRAAADTHRCPGQGAGAGRGFEGSARICSHSGANACPPRPTMSTPILALPTRQPTPARVHTAPCRDLGSRRAPSWPRPRVCVLCAACRGPFLLSRLPGRSLSSVFAQRCPHAGSSAFTGPGPGGPRHPAGAGSEPACLPAPRPPCLTHSLVAVTGHLNPAEGLGWQLQPETGSRLVPGAARGRPR